MTNDCVQLIPLHLPYLWEGWVDALIVLRPGTPGRDNSTAGVEQLVQGKARIGTEHGWRTGVVVTPHNLTILLQSEGLGTSTVTVAEGIRLEIYSSIDPSSQGSLYL